MFDGPIRLRRRRTIRAGRRSGRWRLPLTGGILALIIGAACWAPLAPRTLAPIVAVDPSLVGTGAQAAPEPAMARPVAAMCRCARSGRRTTADAAANRGAHASGGPDAYARRPGAPRGDQVGSHRAVDEKPHRDGVALGPERQFGGLYDAAAVEHPQTDRESARLAAGGLRR